MTGCLHIVSGKFHLLVDTFHVREVLEIDEEVESRLHSRRLWRGAGIPVVDLREFFGGAAPPPPRAALVYDETEAGDPLMLLFDRIIGLFRFDILSLIAVPHSSGRITEYVDGVIKDAATGQLLFHLKRGVLRQ